MFCRIEELTYNYQHPQTVKQLNLSSTSHFKIHQIEHLENFIKLRSLNLSNNMIVNIQGLDHLRNLKILNLEFNQIKILDGIGNLIQLEELYVSYNEIQHISNNLVNNSKLRILHLAYNDIRNLDGIAVLFQPNFPKSENNSSQQANNRNEVITREAFPQLTTLSLFGNPIVSNINYLSFFKMLIPTLRIIDDRDVNDDCISSGVCPQQEVIILREALSKLLDERNSVMQQLQSYVNAPTTKMSNQKKDMQKYIQNQSNKIRNEKILKDRQELLKLLSQCKDKYQTQLQKYKQKISELTCLYSENIKKNKNKQSVDSFDNHQRHNLTREINDKQYNSINQNRLVNKQIIIQLKQCQERLQKMQKNIRNIDKLVVVIEKQQKNCNILSIILQRILFGYRLQHNLTISDYFKLCKKYLIKQCFSQDEGNEQNVQSGLIYYVQLLKSIIYGEEKDGERIKMQINSVIQLKTKIKNKGLLEIITQLKQQNQQQKQKNINFDREKELFIKKYEKQTKQLSNSWDKLKGEKEEFEEKKKKERNQQHYQIKKKEKYKIMEEDQKTKIIQLKNARNKMENQLERVTIKLMQTEEKLNRRFIELYQFESHFNQFVGQKERIRSLQCEIHEVTQNLRVEQKKLNNLQNKLKQLNLEEGIIQNKINKLQEMCKLKNMQLLDIGGKYNETASNLEKIKYEYNVFTEKLEQIIKVIENKEEELKDYEKMGERVKKNYTLLEQKIKNIEHIESNKKTIIKQLQEETKYLKQDKQTIINQIENLDKNLEGKREELLKCQIKIQENKLATENLADINKSVSDMMIRQMELKRSIIELEIQNKNLMEMKNNLIEEYRMKQEN